MSAFAVRKDGDGSYAVLHTPSGKPVVHGIPKKRDADDLLRRLSALDVDAGAASPPHDVLLALYRCTRAWLTAMADASGTPHYALRMNARRPVD